MVGKVGSALSGALGRVSGVAKGLGMASPAFALPAASFAASLVDPLLEGVRAEVQGGSRLEAATQLLQSEKVGVEARVTRARRIRRDIAVNTQRLAQFAPSLYASLMAGQELPEGGVMIGGEPNTDLVQQVAYMMSKGQFQQQQE